MARTLIRGGLRNREGDVGEAWRSVALQNFVVVVGGVFGLHDLNLHPAHPEEGHFRPLVLHLLDPLGLAAEFFQKKFFRPLHVVGDQSYMMKFAQHSGLLGFRLGVRGVVVGHPPRRERETALGPKSPRSVGSAGER